MSKQAICGNVRVKLREGSDGGKIMGLMERRQRNEAAQLVDDRRIDTDGRGIERSAMHHAMPGRDEAMVVELAFDPAQKRGERVLMGGPFCQILDRPASSVELSFATKCTRCPMPSNSPSQTSPLRPGRSCPSNSENLMLDEPAFRTRMASLMMWLVSFAQRPARGVALSP